MRSCCILVFTFFFYAVTAQTYYISTGGSDAVGNGTIASPWRTLAKAATVVTKEGCTIHVSPGIYMETEQVKLVPGVSIEGEDSSSIIKSAIKDDWKEILSLRSEEGTKGNQHISNLTFDGQDLSSFWAIYISGRSQVSIYNCSFSNFKDRGVIFNGRNDDKAEAPGIFATGNTFYNNRMYNCAAYNTGNGVYGRGCLNIGGQEGMLIYDNIMVQNQRPDGYNGYLIKYQNDGYLKGVKIYNNTFTKIPFAGNYGGDNGWDFALEFWNVLGGMEIHHNKIQGAIDIVKTSRGSFPYGLWIHDNTLEQPVLNKHYESGVILEFSNESVLLENNVFRRISGGILLNAQENSMLEDIIIRNNRFEELGRNIGNGNNGSGININCGTLLGNTNHYVLSNLVVYNNIFTAARGNAPFYGIEVTNAGSVLNMKVQKNRIEGFMAACLVANPAKVIDSLLLENNTLAGNGNNNEPLFVIGTPANYVFTNNERSGTGQGFYFREQLLRPLYHEARNMNPLQAIVFASFIIFFLFARREVIYAFPACILFAAVSVFLHFEEGHTAQAALYTCFIGLSAYGILVWMKRDKRRHRIVRITSSEKKDWLYQSIFFVVAFALIVAAMRYYKSGFSAGTNPLVDSFIYASALAGMWGIVTKKAQSWYWWIASNAVAIPVSFSRHYLLDCLFYFFLLFLSVWILFKWKKRRVTKRIS